MIFLGIDPGLASTGYGVVEGNIRDATILDFGCIRTTPGRETPDRLCHIYDEVLRVIRQWKPEGVSMEDVFSAPRMPRAALGLGEVRGVVTLAAVQSGLRVMQLPARQVKQALTGSGSADKEQLERALRRLTGWTETIRPSHASDALAIAVVGLSRWESGLDRIPPGHERIEHERVKHERLKTA